MFRGREWRCANPNPKGEKRPKILNNDSVKDLVKNYNCIPMFEARREADCCKKTTVFDKVEGTTV